MNKKLSVIIVGIIVAVATAAIMIVLTENNLVNPVDTNTPVSLVPSGPWVPCAVEPGTCHFIGDKKIVRYGGDNQWDYGTFTDSASCSNTTFDAMVSNLTKSCSYQGEIPTGGEWGQCAVEDEYCWASSGEVMTVSYGTSAHNVYGKFDSTVFCSNTTFGDPAVGSVKTCHLYLPD